MLSHNAKKDLHENRKVIRKGCRNNVSNCRAAMVNDGIQEDENRRG